MDVGNYTLVLLKIMVILCWQQYILASVDLSALDVCLCGDMKYLVYQQIVETQDKLVCRDECCNCYNAGLQSQRSYATYTFDSWTGCDMCWGWVWSFWNVIVNSTNKALYKYMFVYVCLIPVTASPPTTVAAWSEVLKYLRLLEHWDRGFEPHSRHGCMSAFILCLCR
jgi:hypothetical protein